MVIDVDGYAKFCLDDVDDDWWRWWCWWQWRFMTDDGDGDDWRSWCSMTNEGDDDLWPLRENDGWFQWWLLILTDCIANDDDVCWLGWRRWSVRVFLWIDDERGWVTIMVIIGQYWWWLWPIFTDETCWSSVTNDHDIWWGGMAKMSRLDIDNADNWWLMVIDCL